MFFYIWFDFYEFNVDFLFEKISEQKKTFFQKKIRVLALFYNFDF